MDGSPPHTIGNRLNGESRMQVYEGWSPLTNLGVRGFGELTISMAECEKLALVILAKTEK
jgi:hypothetical protein